ncbi:MAG TPA: neutral/alkaline non-lysosomal ceramidase N-terminal domain-containing protein, partial [Verrucomicrobiae bacterium]|nr:neutral/alkaline non-lysosomal ceramidase N-terminal domain-containing protein [Verrucomicrobiae bacterium]
MKTKGWRRIVASAVKTPLTRPSDTVNLVAADVSPLHLLLGKVRADSRPPSAVLLRRTGRLLQFRGSTREVTFRGNLSPSDGVKGSRAILISWWGTKFVGTLKKSLALCCIISLALGWHSSAQEASLFKAGVARVNLTPPMEMKAALGGYGARMSKPAIGVHDAVWAKALVLAKGERRFALVTADVLGFPPQFKAAVIERLAGENWRADQIMLLPSHTHTSFDLMALHPGNTFGIPQVGVFHNELFEHTANQLAKVIREAGGKLNPVVAGSTTVSVPDRNRNRRHGAAEHDTDLTVTRVDASAGRPLAVLVNWTAHPTFMDAEDMLFSGDWPGHLQRTMEALIGQGVIAMFYNGAEGDQSPTPPPAAASNWERAEGYGREMGIRAWRVWEKIRPSEVKAFGYHTETITLPKRTWHPDFMKTGGAEYGLNETMMPAFLDALQPTQTRTTSFRLGDLVILGVPGEMAAQLGM